MTEQDIVLEMLAKATAPEPTIPEPESAPVVVRPSHGQIIHAMMDSLSINPTIIYCQVTGAPIGSMSRAEFQFLLSTLSPDLSLDEIVDDLYVRTVASMRVGPAWTFIEAKTLERMRRHDPIRVCAFLLGRLYEPKDGAYDRTRRTLNQRLTDGRNRIVGYRKLSRAAIDPELMTRFTTALLLLDSHFNLALMPVPEGFPASPDELDPANLALLCDLLDSTFQALCLEKDKLERKARLQESWMIAGGNRLTADVARSAFRDTKPKSEAELAKLSKAADQNLLVNAMRAMIDGSHGVQQKFEERAKDTAPKSGAIKFGSFKQ